MTTKKKGKAGTSKSHTRDEHINICLFADEYERIVRVAKHEGYAKSTYCRNVLLKHVRDMEKKIKDD